MKFRALEIYVANSTGNGGPRDLRVIADIEAFVRRHADIFSYDKATQQLSLDPLIRFLGIDPQAEVRVVQRLTARLQRGPWQAHLTEILVCVFVSLFNRVPRFHPGSANCNFLASWSNIIY